MNAMDPSTDMVTMTPEVAAALERWRRIQAGERHRTVYEFDDEKMDDFMYRMLENRYVADLNQLAAAFASGGSPPTVGPGEVVPANEALAAKYRTADRGEDSKPEGTRESLERCAKMLDTYGPDCFPANELGQIHFARAMMESTADEIRAFLSRPDAGVSEDVRAAAERELNRDGPGARTWQQREVDRDTLSRFVLSLPPARGYDAGFAAGTDAERQRLVNWLRESDLPDEARYVEQGLHDGLTEHVVAPAADRDAEKCP